jgi:hypothetical protein
VIAFTTNGSVSDLFASKYRVFPSAWKEDRAALHRTSAFLGERLHAGVVDEKSFLKFLIPVDPVRIA